MHSTCTAVVRPYIMTFNGLSMWTLDGRGRTCRQNKRTAAISTVHSANRRSNILLLVCMYIYVDSFFRRFKEASFGLNVLLIVLVLGRSIKGPDRRGLPLRENMRAGSSLSLQIVSSHECRVHY